LSARESHWFAIQTQPRREDFATSRLDKLGFEVFLPRARRERPVCGVVKKVIQALFPGYAFARFCPASSLSAVRYAPGVLRVVGTTLAPLPVPAEIIEGIRAREDEAGLIPIARKFQEGDSVVIEYGPFAGLIGRFEREAEDGKRVAILLEAIQHARVLISKDWLALGE
jgi:transcriptional antiterminator RfaH